jgi:short-chain Z-isoprenyl diphosphate synthase
MPAGGGRIRAMASSRSTPRLDRADHVRGRWRAMLSPLRGWDRWLYWLYERRLLAQVRAGGRLPRHVGVIMDGNRRFARALGIDATAGHDHGADKARDVLEWALELGIPHMTLWGFSSDNRGRPPDEVAHLHSLFAAQAREFLTDERLRAHEVQVRVIGDIEDFPDDTKAALHALEASTAHHERLHLHVALGYGGREEIVAAVRRLLQERADAGDSLPEAADSLSAEDIERHLYTAGTPDPDFVIRTSGEVRLSGFLLWQTAYSEFYFCDAFWPEFRKIDFLRALRSFQQRERRFGR